MNFITAFLSIASLGGTLETSFEKYIWAEVKRFFYGNRNEIQIYQYRETVEKAYFKRQLNIGFLGSRLKPYFLGSLGVIPVDNAGIDHTLTKGKEPYAYIY